MTPFSPQDLANIFKNVYYKENKSPGFTYTFDIIDCGSYTGEIAYSEPLKEWVLIKDNFPAQRVGFRCDFPIRHLETLIELCASVRVLLIKN